MQRHDLYSSLVFSCETKPSEFPRLSESLSTPIILLVRSGYHLVNFFPEEYKLTKLYFFRDFEKYFVFERNTWNVLDVRKCNSPLTVGSRIKASPYLSTKCFCTVLPLLNTCVAHCTKNPLFLGLIFQYISNMNRKNCKPKTITCIFRRSSVFFELLSDARQMPICTNLEAATNEHMHINDVTEWALHRITGIAQMGFIGVREG